MDMKVVITGTSRGIGLALARRVIEAGHELLAVARQPQQSPALMQLAGQHPDRLKLHAADLRDPQAAASIARAAGTRDAVDVLVNNAGILLPGDGPDDFAASFRINSVAPFEVTRALLPLLKASANPRAAHITSKMGSIADNKSGGHYAYRASKAALNAINRSLSLDHPWLAAVVIHPGWVKTDMGGEGAPVAPEDSAAGIWRLLEGLTRKDSGAFFDYQGNALPW
jgi:NAD(P)-dependent dehydrogenase (short-subunit alcohol dehydrogenase family)